MSLPDILFRLNGTIVPVVKFADVTIRDILGAQPNTATILFLENEPVAGAAIEIGVGSFTLADLIFAGEVQQQAQTYEARTMVVTTRYPADLIDWTFQFNKRRPIASYVAQSATAIAQDLVSTFAPSGFTSSNVQTGLPVLTINFDGSQTLMEAINELAKLINGRTKIDYGRNVHLYLPPEAGVSNPDPLTLANPPLNNPPIQFDTDLSQVRTRVYGRGYGENVPIAVAAGETIIPITDGATFTATGGKAIAGTTADGAKTKVVQYTGIQLGGAGSVVGGSIAPAVAPVGTPQPGTGLGSGTYKYAYTWITASGESVPSPLATVTTGAIAAPSVHPTLPSQPSVGNGPDPGVHMYGLTFMSGTGETTVWTSTNNVTTFDDPTNPAPGTASEGGGNNSGLWPVGADVYYVMTYTWSGGETGAGFSTNHITATVASPGPYAKTIVLSGIPVPGAGVTQKTIYRIVNGVAQGKNVMAVNVTGVTDAVGTGFTQGTFTLPSAGTMPHRVVPITGIQIGPAGVTARRLYRTTAGTSTLKLLTTISDNTTTTYTDTVADASLGATSPASNTTANNQVAVSAIAVGPGAVTNRKVYRTAVNASQLKLLTTIANNTATTYTDTAADGTLGANAPTTDTSGLVTTSGQVAAGSTSLVTASAAPFSTAGGWAVTGYQYIRYTGVSGNTLTGIPATGAGAIVTTIPYGNQIAPVPALTGVTGLTAAMEKGASINIWVQRDDVSAQTALAGLERNPDGSGTDGIREYLIVDERRNEASLATLCDADLESFAHPIISVQYSTFDPKSKAGTTVDIDLAIQGPFNPAVFNAAVFNTGMAFGYAGSYLIQDVTITIDRAPLPGRPRYVVHASSQRFTFTDLLRRVLLRPI